MDLVNFNGKQYNGVLVEDSWGKTYLCSTCTLTGYDLGEDCRIDAKHAVLFHWFLDDLVPRWNLRDIWCALYRHARPWDVQLNRYSPLELREKVQQIFLSGDINIWQLTDGWAVPPTGQSGATTSAQSEDTSNQYTARPAARKTRQPSQQDTGVSVTTTTAAQHESAPAPNQNTQQLNSNAAELEQTPSQQPYLEPGRVYGGMTLPCGGRDSTQCKVFKDPATVNLDQEEWRKPSVKNGVVLPLDGTNGKPKKIKSAKEAGQTATREFMGETYKINKDEHGFPEFTVFETYLSDEHINSGDDDAHFRAANKRLGELLKDDQSLKQTLGLTDKQYRYFTAEPPRAGTPKGVTWHHHQDVGKMQLVHEGLHGRFGHVGGMEIWGGSRV